jgi:hypothetical protein
VFGFRWNKKSEILGHIKEMKKEKLRLTEKRREKVESSSTSIPAMGGVSRLAKNKYSVSRGCKEDLSLKKRVIIKNDGRYLIYYDF